MTRYSKKDREDAALIDEAVERLLCAADVATEVPWSTEPGRWPADIVYRDIRGEDFADAAATLTAQAAWERAYNLLGFNGTDAFKGQWDWRLCALEGAALLLDGWRP